jgi:hypothetical protein
MPTPVQCAIVPRALRVVVPRNRPGTQPGRQQFSWRRLWQLAGVRRLTDDKVPGLPRNGYRDITAVELRDMMAGPGL